MYSMGGGGGGGGHKGTFELVKAKDHMGVLNLQALVPVRACLLQVQEDGGIHKGMRIEMTLSYLHGKAPGSQDWWQVRLTKGQNGEPGNSQGSVRHERVCLLMCRLPMNAFCQKMY